MNKRIKDIIDVLNEPDEAKKQLKAAQNEAKYLAMSEKDISKEIRRLEKVMLQAAKNLEFEKAAALRDELKKLRETMLFEGGPGSAE